MVYATVEEVEAGFRTLSDDEKTLCSALLAEAGIVIDAYSQDAPFERKQLVSCRMVRRQLDAGPGGQGAAMYPMGATQASASALGYQQSWTVSGGSVGELYLSKLEKKLLGVGEDAFHAPIYTETPVTVHNVLVGEPATEDIINDLQLYGRRLAYTLALPKGDAHDWHNVTVEFWGQKFRTYGDVVQGIDDLIPLCWNKKVKVERYE